MAEKSNLQGPVVLKMDGTWAYAGWVVEWDADWESYSLVNPDNEEVAEDDDLYCLLAMMVEKADAANAK